MPRYTVSGVLVNILPQATFKRNMLEQIMRCNPQELELTKSAEEIVDELLLNVNEDIEEAREEKMLDTNIQGMKQLHFIAHTVLQPYLARVIPTLQSVPLLLEAIHLKYIIIPNLNPRYFFSYVLSSQAHINLMHLMADEDDVSTAAPPQALVDLILNTPFPSTPVFHRTVRRLETQINLPPPVIEKLYKLGNFLLLSSGTERQDAAALDWILLSATPTTSGSN